MSCNSVTLPEYQHRMRGSPLSPRHPVGGLTSKTVISPLATHKDLRELTTDPAAVTKHDNLRDPTTFEKQNRVDQSDHRHSARTRPHRNGKRFIRTLRAGRDQKP